MEFLRISPRLESDTDLSTRPQPHQFGPKRPPPLPEPEAEDEWADPGQEAAEEGGEEWVDLRQDLEDFAYAPIAGIRRPISRVLHATSKHVLDVVAE